MAVKAQLVTSMQVKNFACLRDVSVQLTPLHAFIGPNDSGKSTLLRALRTGVHLTTSIFEAGEGAPDGVGEVRPFDPGMSPGASVHLSFGDATSYRFTVGSESRIEEEFRWDSVRRSDNQTRGWLSPDVGAPVLGPFARAPHTLASLTARLKSGARLVHWMPAVLKRPSGLIPENNRRDFNDEHGSGLPGILDAVLNRGDDSFLKIVDGVRRFFPTVRTIRLRPISRDTKVIEIELTSGTRVPATFASEGLLFYLAFAALQFLDPVAMLLVEEPENGLHPARIADVMKILREVSQTTQVVLATHSPLVINEMQGDEVTLLTREPETGTQARRLSETPNFAERSKVYALGELWLSYANGVDEAPLLSDDAET